ncbi:hypothetical protein ACPROK_14505 [Glutamicibacter soli]|uniref:hypothetical protein n=1 Tax=Glutamicibacter soli TaxID=453836 RepID=UPI003C752B2D
MNTNTTSTRSEPIELPATAFGCSPREVSECDDDLLRLLIKQLDELTRPDKPGRLS